MYGFLMFCVIVTKITIRVVCSYLLSFQDLLIVITHLKQQQGKTKLIFFVPFSFSVHTSTAKEVYNQATM